MSKTNILTFEKVVEALMDANNKEDLKRKKLTLEGSIEAFYHEKLTELNKKEAF